MMNEEQKSYFLNLLKQHRPPALTEQKVFFWGFITERAFEELYLNSELFTKQVDSAFKDYEKLNQAEKDVFSVEIFFYLLHYCYGALWMFEHLEEQSIQEKSKFRLIFGYHEFELG